MERPLKSVEVVDVFDESDPLFGLLFCKSIRNWGGLFRLIMTQLIMLSDDYVSLKLKGQVLVITTIFSLFLGPLVQASEVSSFRTNATSPFGSSFSSGVYDHADYCLPLKPRVNHEQMKNNTSRKNKPKQYKINSKPYHSNLENFGKSAQEIQIEKQKQSYEDVFKSFPFKGKALGIGEGGTDVEVRYLKIDDFVDRPNRKNHFVRLMCIDPEQQQECFISFTMTHPGDLKEIIKTCREMQTKEHDWAQIENNEGVASVQVSLSSDRQEYALKIKELLIFDVLGPSGNGEVVTVQSKGSAWGRGDGLGPHYQTEIHFPRSKGVITPPMEHQGLVSLPSESGVK